MLDVPQVRFIAPDGHEHRVDARVGRSLMEAAISHGVLGILADCGGCCTCATCHVYVPEDWLQRLPPRSTDEEGMLEFAIDPQDNSRLSCQIVVTDELDGLQVHLPKSQL